MEGFNCKLIQSNLINTNLQYLAWFFEYEMSDVMIGML
jgi:hypothetical protein